MVQKIIGLGVPDKGNGDPLRTAFSKVNDNFAELYNSVSAVVVVGATAPINPSVGDLWWNSESGRMYVYYGTAWVDASPVDGAGINSTNELVNGNKTVSLASTGIITLPSSSYLESTDTNLKVGAQGTVTIRSNAASNLTTKAWTFGTDGALTVPSVPWNYTPTTFTSIPTTYGAAQLTFTVLPDNTFTNMSVAVGGGGYGADNQQLTVPGTTFPGGASPANDIVFNVTTFPVPDFPSEITTASIVTYVSGNPPQRYDNIESSGSVGIGANNSHWTFSADGSTTLPGAVVKSTVAKTGATIPTTTGPINNFDFSPLDGSGGLVDGTNIGPLTVGTMIFYVTVENGLPFGSYIQTQPILTIGDTIGTIDSGDLGGTPGTTFTITVSNVVQETPTAIDLTKSVNKLTDGAYTLANGVEGQIMYLVRQTGAVFDAVFVTVDSFRYSGDLYTLEEFEPFKLGGRQFDVVTLIYTDDAWQSSRS